LQNYQWSHGLPEESKLLPFSAMFGLALTLKKQNNFDEAQKVLRDITTLINSDSTCDSDSITTCTNLMLSQVLFEKGDLSESLLYVRGAYSAIMR
jgi:hypothetical protein